MNRNGLIILSLIALILVGGYLRARTIAAHPLWFDEADTWRASIMDPRLSEFDPATGLVKPEPMAYSKFFLWENHFETAPLSFLLVRLSADAFGTDAEWAMRMPSLIAGILCIPAAFWLGSVVYSPLLGLIVAALVAFDPNAVDQSRQARMYSLMLLLLLVAAAWAIKLVRAPSPGAPSRQGGANTAQPPAPSRSPDSRAPIAPPYRDGAPAPFPYLQWSGLGIILGLLLCTSQFTTAVWFGIALGTGGLLALGKFTGQPHPQTFKIALGLTLAYLVGLLVANLGVIGIINRVLHGGPGDGANLTKAQIAREIATSAKDLINLTNLGLIVYAFAAVGIVLLIKRCKTSTAILVGLAVTNLLVLFPFRKMHHFMDGRYLMILKPALWVGLAMLAVGFRHHLLRGAGIVIILAYLGLQAYQSSVKLDAYPQQPDRYLFAQEIIKTRDALKPGETVSIFPGVAVQLGMYYKVPQDTRLLFGLYDRDGVPLPTGSIPRDLSDHVEAVWLVLGMYNYDDEKGAQKARRVNLIQALAQRYGTYADPAQIDKHIRQRHITRVRISREGVTVSSVSLE
ncbi:MAG: glycosyltransferase family 39 protein [Phycisphaeraceae bacterium]